MFCFSFWPILLFLAPYPELANTDKVSTFHTEIKKREREVTLLDALWAEGGWEGGAKTNQDIKRRQRKANLIKEEGENTLLSIC